MSKMTFVVCLVLVSTFLSGCKINGAEQASSNDQDLLQQTVNKYFSLYQKRIEFSEFISLYHQDARLEDVNYGTVVEGREQIAMFFNWLDSSVQLMNKEQALVVQSQVIQNNIVVTEGYFTPFKYHGTPMGPWRFVIWLEFNQEHKIIRHVDWINYTPKDKFLGGENLNQLLPN